MAFTIAEGFDELSSNLEITGLQAETTSTRQTNIRKVIEAGMDVVDTFLTGSYMRNTMIAPLKEADIDIFVWLAKEYYSDDGHAALLEEVKTVLKKSYKTPKISPNGQAVTMTFSDFRVDVVAGFHCNDGSYLIPDTAKWRWIATDPKKHVEIWTRENKANDSKLVPLIKMIKAWNKKRELLRSFHLECLVLKVFEDTLIEDFPSAVRYFFDKARWLLTIGIDDPAGWGGDVGDYLTGERKRTARSRMEAAFQHAADAEHLEEQKRTAAAYDHWEIVFGDYFPAYG